MCVRAASLRSRSAGFTLVELMVVVAVIGVGGGLALFNMSEQVADARAKADGHAMMERIRQEHRVAKERMTGLLLTPTDGGRKLIFAAAKKCKPLVDVEPKKVEFMKSTNLVISGDDSYCWDEAGRPRPLVLASDSEGGASGAGIPSGNNGPSSPNLDFGETATADSPMPSMGIFVHLSNPVVGVLTPIHVTQVGVSAGKTTQVAKEDVETTVGNDVVLPVFPSANNPTGI